MEIFVLKSAQWWYSACISVYTVSYTSILPVICMPTTPSNIAMDRALKHQDLGEWRPRAVRNRHPIYTQTHILFMCRLAFVHIHFDGMLGWVFAISTVTVYLCPTFKRWKRLQVCLLLRICMCMHACIAINITAITHHLRRHRCHYDFLYHNRHHPHALRSPQPPPGRPRMEQLNNRIRSTRRMCFREQIPWNVADVDSNGDECEDGHLVPARFHIFFFIFESVVLARFNV